MTGLGIGNLLGARAASLPSRPAYDAASRRASGRAPPGAAVTVLVDGVSAGTATADAQGTWSHVLGTAPGAGQAIRARAEVTSAARLVATPAATAATVRRLAGFGGDQGNQIRPSDGTKTTFNVRKRFFSPVKIADPEVAYTGIHYNSGAEYDYPNEATYHSAIELPDGTIRDMGAPVTVAPGTILARSQKAAGFTIPAGFYWIRTCGRVPAGGKWHYTDAFRSANVGHMEEGVDLADKAAAGSIGNASQQMPAAAIGVIGDMPASHRLVALAGDSISQGVGGYSHAGAPGLAIGILSGLVLQSGVGSVLPLGRAGASAQANRAHYAKRIALMQALGVTDILCDLGVNDLSSSASAAALKAYLTTLFNAFRSALPDARIYQSTITPSTSATAPITETNQTVPAAMQDGRRLAFNADLRGGGLAPLVAGVVEFALPAQLDADPNLWKAGYASDAGNPGAQQHPNQTGGEAIVASAAAANPLALAG
ncbi:SGNH/GDSL hydrolase family protein [Aureimonas flava]|uniref:SGNH/GDSL hydrolase family protein n=1 Tax=Aureimonas flava TaxID=2320271 RepID=A0A3A1WQV7_9HYPH|nr:GDSL-type esterase/lipase family protein [Aureimonas flava]RIY02600.1 SGNH/GDSL hydrolase family protein [Aureimonas flava]